MRARGIARSQLGAGVAAPPTPVGRGQERCGIAGRQGGALSVCVDFTLPQTATAGVRKAWRDARGHEWADVELDVRWEDWSAGSDTRVALDGSARQQPDVRLPLAPSNPSAVPPVQRRCVRERLLDRVERGDGVVVIPAVALAAPRALTLRRCDRLDADALERDTDVAVRGCSRSRSERCRSSARGTPAAPVRGVRSLRVEILGVIVASQLASTGCDPCGPPAEPLVTVEVVISQNVQPRETDYLHLEMQNAAGAHVTSYHVPVASIESFPFEHLLGNCDGTPQQSGTFTIRGWLSLQRYDAIAPAPTDPQDQTTVAVVCRNDGCYAAGAVALEITAP